LLGKWINYIFFIPFLLTSKIEIELQTQDPILLHCIEKIKDRSRALLSTIPSIFPEYTPHTIEHKEQVLSNYDLFLPESLIKKFNKYELFFLISSTYLHDIGMSYVKELDDLTDQPVDKISDYIREHHHIRAEEFIKNNPDKLGIEDEHQAFIIGRICRGHRKEDLRNEKLFAKEYAYKEYPINIALLAMALRIADRKSVV